MKRLLVASIIVGGIALLSIGMERDPKGKGPATESSSMPVDEPSLRLISAEAAQNPNDAKDKIITISYAVAQESGAILEMLSNPNPKKEDTGYVTFKEIAFAELAIIVELMKKVREIRGFILPDITTERTNPFVAELLPLTRKYTAIEDLFLTADYLDVNPLIKQAITATIVERLVNQALTQEQIASTQEQIASIKDRMLPFVTANLHDKITTLDQINVAFSAEDREALSRISLSLYSTDLLHPPLQNAPPDVFFPPTAGRGLL